MLKPTLALSVTHYESEEVICEKLIERPIDEAHREIRPFIGDETLHEQIGFHPVYAETCDLSGDTPADRDLRAWEVEAAYQFWCADKPVYVMSPGWADEAATRPLDYRAPPLLDLCMFVRMPGSLTIKHQDRQLPLQGFYAHRSYVTLKESFARIMSLFFVSEIPQKPGVDTGERIRFHFHFPLKSFSLPTTTLFDENKPVVVAAIEALELLGRIPNRKRRLNRRPSPAGEAYRRERDGDVLMDLPYFEVELI